MEGTKVRVHGGFDGTRVVEEPLDENPRECATCDGSGEDPVGMPGESCPDCGGAKRHVVVVRLTFTEREWKALARAARYHGETRRRVVETEARLGVEAEILAVESGAREGRK